MTVRESYHAFAGGLDTESPPTAVRAGHALNSLNYEVGENGGYRRILGYERFDGTLPQVNEALGVEFIIATPAAAIAAGDVLEYAGILFEVHHAPVAVRQTSQRPLDADAFRLLVSAHPIDARLEGAAVAAGLYTPPAGPSPTGFDTAAQAAALADPTTVVPPVVADTALNRAGVQVATVATATHADGSVRTVAATVARNGIVTEARRAQIGAVPGTGPVRGVAAFDGVLYAMRDIDTGTGLRGGLFVSGINGWRELVQNIAAPPAVRAPGGRGEFIIATVSGTVAGLAAGNTAQGRRLYGCDGVNPAFEIDGNGTRTDIGPTGAMLDGQPNERPQFLIEYKQHLFLSYAGGLLQFSELGDPLGWDVANGAGFVQFSDEITGLSILPNDALLVTCRHRTFVCLGTPGANFSVTEYSDTLGALPYTVQRLYSAVWADDRGIVNFDQVQSFGNFADGTLTQKVASLYRQFTPSVSASVLSRTRNQYRLFRDDGEGLYLTFDERRLAGIMRVRFPHPVACTFDAEDDDGTELVVFGSVADDTDAAYVFCLDRGFSFDGQPIEAMLRPVFDHVSSPERRKRFRKLTLHLQAGSGGALRVLPDFSYGGTDTVPGGGETFAVRPTDEALLGGEDSPADDSPVARWSDDEFAGGSTQRIGVKVDGTGVNFGATLYSRSAHEAPHTLYGAALHYTPRRLER